MPDDEGQRKLAAILAADVVGYSRLMADDERATVAALKEARTVFKVRIEAHGGRLIDTAGDSVLAEFRSVVEAVQCAVEVQEQLAKDMEAVPDHRRMYFRIGVNLGDVIEESDGTIYGDGVNIAARLEGLAEPGGIMISDFARQAVEGKLDAGFQDAGTHTLKNIDEPVRAYRFASNGTYRKPAQGMPKSVIAVGLAAAIIVGVGGVMQWLSDNSPDERAQPPAEVTGTADPILAMPTGPSIAVLPLESLGNDTDQTWLAHGLTEEIIAGLSKFHELLVYASDTSIQYAGQDARAIGEALGVNYVIKGSVQRGDGRVRVAVRLLDAGSGAQLWSETYDEALEARALFAVQDAIRERVVGTLAGSYGVISQAGLAEAQARGTENLTAYECVLSAYDYERVFTPERHAEVRDCLERAVELDPNYADAWAKLAFVTTDEYAWGFNPRPNSMLRAMEAARKAVALDPTSQTTRWHLARSHYWNGDREAFFLETQKALALNPNNSFVLAAAGAYYANSGDPTRGAELARKAMAINPHHPTWYHFPTFQDLFARGLYVDALAEANRINLPGYYWTHAAIATAAGMAGDPTAAKSAVIDLQRTYPGFTLETGRQEFAKGVQKPEGNDFDVRFIEGLRRAGVPESDPKSTRPVIAVLPFDNMNGDPEQEYFSDGITEDIITRLSMFQELGVIARNSTFQFKGRAVDVREAAKELGASHVVEGSIRRSSERIRVTAQLIYADNGEHLWSASFDRNLSVADIFEIQDEISEQIAATIGDSYGAISRTALMHRDGAAPERLDAYECVLKAHNYYASLFSSTEHERVRACLESTVDDTSTYADGMAWLAAMYRDEFWVNFNPRPEPLKRALATANRALAIDRENQEANLVRAQVHYLQRDYATFLNLAERALALNPNSADLLASLGMPIAYAGEWERGLSLMEKAKTLNPRYPGWFLLPEFFDHFRTREYTSALMVIENVDLPYFWLRFAGLAATLGQIGEIEKARPTIERLRELLPDAENVIRGEFRKMFASESLVSDLVNGLQRAGMEIPSND